MIGKIGKDGYPIPKVKDTGRFSCLCIICLGATATLKEAKSGNWIVKCPSCSTITYLNSITSINLFRGFQAYMENNPQNQVLHSQGIIEHAPNEGE